MKKIHLTESQMRRIISEMTLSGDEDLIRTKDPKTAAKDTLMNAKTSGLNVDSTGT